MSAEGAAGLLGQTLTDLAREVDMAAEARGTLDSAEFLAFRDLVRSIYVGKLQKRVNHVEKQGNINMDPPPADPERPNPREGEQSQKTPLAPEAHNARKRRTGPLSAANPPQNIQQDQSNSKGSSGSSSTEVVASAGYQSCSGDIAQALVAIAMGEGFDMLYSGRHGENSNSGRSSDVDEGKLGGPMVRDRIHTSRLESIVGGGRDAGRGNSSLSRGENTSKSNHRGMRTSKMELEAGAALRYLSEDSASKTAKEKSDEGGEENADKKEAAAGRQESGCIPGLDWLAPHIIGRSIPMTLR